MSIAIIYMSIISYEKTFDKHCSSRFASIKLCEGLFHLSVHALRKFGPKLVLGSLDKNCDHCCTVEECPGLLPEVAEAMDLIKNLGL